MKLHTQLAVTAFAFAAANGSSAQDFEGTLTFNEPAPGRPRTLFTDVNGDGLIDILLSSESVLGGGSVLFWLRATAPGEFAEAAPLISSNGGVGRPILADVDGDGDEELIGQVTGVGIGMFERTSNGFTQDPVVVTPLLGPVIDTNFGDINGDGIGDYVSETIVSLMGGSEVYVQFGDSTGAFGPRQFVASIAATDFLRVTDVFDIDGDGDDDLLMNRRDEELAVVRWSPGAGFGPVEILDPAADEIISTLSVDFNGDGLLDILYGSFGSLGGLRMVPGEPGGTFGAPIATDLPPVSDFVLRLTAGDLDGDGLEDILVRSGDGLVWLRQIGAGTYAPAELAAASTVIGGVAKVGLADVDADGNLDAVTSLDFANGRAVGLLPGLGLGTGPPLGEAVQISATRENELVHAVGDLDGDGSNEVLSMQRFDPIRPLVHQIQPEEIVSGAPAPRFTRRALGALAQSSARQITMSDMDGDQLEDVLIVTAGSELVFLPAEPGLSLGAAVVLGSVSQRVRPVVEDIDLDGLPDVVGASLTANATVWFPNLGGNVFGPEQLLQAAQNPLTQIRFEDLDADGARDLIVAEEQTLPGPVSGRVAWSPRLGSTFGARQTLSSGPQTDATALAVGDIDEDGLPDVVWGTQNTTRAFWARNAGSGSFAAPQILREIGNFCEELEIADIDLDGRNDLVTRLRRSIRYSLNAGSASFPSLVQVQASTTVLSLGDVDTDGDLDIVSSTEFSSELGFSENRAIDLVGVSLCGPAMINASGASGQISAGGSASVAANELQLIASDLPQSSFGYFLTSDDTAITFPVPASVGRLCLGGSIGRYVGPGQVQNSGAAGQFSLDIDVTMLPTPTGPVAAATGETRYFQTWFRDVDTAGAATSNFTDAIAVTWQ